ncbi:MAG: hypothetical protein NTW86_16340 [Candidatus Sumerlaeota bacterium]|nr:hypothetical protein [Candidatus Sumerlaeota bacterium]
MTEAAKGLLFCFADRAGAPSERRSPAREADPAPGKGRGGAFRAALPAEGTRVV